MAVQLVQNLTIVQSNARILRYSFQYIVKVEWSTCKYMQEQGGQAGCWAQFDGLCCI